MKRADNSGSAGSAGGRPPSRVEEFQGSSEISKGHSTPDDPAKSLNRDQEGRKWIDNASVSLGEAAAIGRIEKALFGGDERLVQVGRYEIIDAIGAGSFGKVYRARDPQLHRAVALKVLAVEHARGEDLLGEARIMATIGHPNVATIYDAGVVADITPPRVFLAIELVDGSHLRNWLTTARTPANILDALAQAARGLVAAHAAGVVHRDFKPENVLVGSDGRVRVVDFGLARPATTIDARAIDVDETSTATVAGTPAYMAPELLAGGQANTATDQFAFCVTLWEALYGARPFTGRSVAELTASVARPVSVPRRPRIPRRVVRALVKGLAVNPTQRHASMAALVRELEFRPRPTRRSMLVTTAASVGLAIAVVVAATRTLGMSSTEPCPRATSQLAGVWDPWRRAAIGAAFRATALPQAAATFDRVSGELDRMTNEWLDAHHAACTATHVRHEQSAEALDRRMACLHDWRRQLATTTTSFARATPTVVTLAMRALFELPPLARCANDSELALGPSPSRDPATIAKLDELGDQLAQARVQYFEGNAQQAIETAQAVEREATALHDDTLRVATTLWQGQTLVALGRFAEARDVSRRCFDLALAIRDQRSAALAASALAFNGAFDSTLATESLQWIATGTALLHHLENADEVEGSLAHVEGSIHLAAADPANARTAFERALAAWRRIAPEHPNAPTSMAMLGVAELYLGAADQARQHLRESVRLTERDMGPAYSESGNVLVNLALAEAATGDYREAAAAIDRGLTIQIGALGMDNPAVGYAHLNRGQVAMAMGNHVMADRSFAEAERIVRKVYGPSHAVTTVVELAMAEHAARTGRGALARDHAAQAAAGLNPADHGPRALAQSTLALGEMALGYRAQAERAVHAALSELALAQIATASQRAIVHDNCGEVLLALGQTVPAIAELRLAATELDHGPPDPWRRAQIQLALARATSDRALAAAALAALPADIDASLRAPLSKILNSKDK